MSMTPEQQRDLEYHERCRITSKYMGLTLRGSTPGVGFSSVEGGHIPHMAMGHIEDLRTRLATAERENFTLAAKLEGCRKALEYIAACTDAPDLNQGQMRLGLHCGLEDRNITDHYSAADYGFEDATERTLVWAKNAALSALPPAAGEVKP